MATKKQKEELLEALRAEKKKYDIHLSGYGGEIVIGSITKEQYEFWKDRDDLDEYAYDWDNNIKVPEDMKIFVDGNWHECDNLVHENGIEFSSACWIIVYDQDGNEVFQCCLNEEDLENKGIGIDGMNNDEYYVRYDSDAEYCFLGQNIEKGTFQTYEVEIYGKFDPKKLNFSTIDIEGWRLVNGVSYESVELDDTCGYSTTGKGSEFKVFEVER